MMTKTKCRQETFPCMLDKARFNINPNKDIRANFILDRDQGTYPLCLGVAQGIAQEQWLGGIMEAVDRGNP